MRVLIMRHGIAIDRDDPDCPDDAHRHLTDEGIARTRQAARGLRRLEVRPALILTSPWRRAAETAAICREVLDLEPDRVQVSDALHPARSAEETLAYLASLDEEEVLLVGHAPLLDEIVSALLGRGSDPVTSLKKASVVSVQWSVNVTEGWIEWLLPPRVLRRLGRR